MSRTRIVPLIVPSPSTSISPPAALLHRHHTTSSLIKEHSTPNEYVKKYGCLIGSSFENNDLIVSSTRFRDVAVLTRENLALEFYIGRPDPLPCP